MNPIIIIQLIVLGLIFITLATERVTAMGIPFFKETMPVFCNVTPNPDLTLIGRGEFEYLPKGGTSGTDEVSFKGIITVNPTFNLVDHKGSYGGLRRTDRVVMTDADLYYTIKVDEFAADFWDIFVMGNATKVPLSALKTGTEGSIKLYDVDDPPDKPTYAHNGFDCIVSVDGSLEVNGEGFSEATLKVSVNGPDIGAYAVNNA